MAYHGGKREVKGLRAARIAAALAYLMLRQGDKASITLFADRVLDHIPAGGTRRHLMTMLRSLVRPAHEAAGRTDIRRPSASATACCAAADGWWFYPISSATIRMRFSTRSCPSPTGDFEILLMQLTDPDEMTLPDAPLARFVDMETGESIEVEPVRNPRRLRSHGCARKATPTPPVERSTASTSPRSHGQSLP